LGCYHYMLNLQPSMEYLYCMQLQQEAIDRQSCTVQSQLQKALIRDFRDQFNNGRSYLPIKSRFRSVRST
jgi:hypothetical protein